MPNVLFCNEKGLALGSGLKEIFCKRPGLSIKPNANRPCIDLALLPGMGLGCGVNAVEV
jgi:hypothetical protein